MPIFLTLNFTKMVYHHTCFFGLAEYYLYLKYRCKICYGLHVRPLWSFILRLYIYYSKRPPSCFKRWFICFARPTKSSFFDLSRLFVIFSRESVFFLIVLSDQLTKMERLWNRTKRRQMYHDITKNEYKSDETIVNSKNVIGPYFSDIFWIQV